MNWPSLSPHLLLLALCLCHPSNGNLATQTCSSNARQAVIQPGAQATIGTILTLHEPGQGGVGCGAIGPDLENVEAIGWALQIINQDSGTINGETITDSYIPGVKIGKS